jgi:hypothetical protein
MKVVQLGSGKKSVEAIAGLIWQPLLPDNIRKELRPLAKELDKDLYVYWKSTHSVAGFASNSEGASVGQVPIALIIAKALEREGSAKSSLVAVSAPDDSGLYFYVSRKNGYILADGDHYGTEDEIKARMLSDFGFGGWELLVCPDHWRISGSEARSFDSFLPTKNDQIRIPSSWGLKPVKTAWQKSVARVLIAAVLLTYGYYEFQKDQVKKRIAEQAAIVAAQEEQTRIQNLRREPWPEIPKAMHFARACEKAIARTGLIAANWNLSSITCEEGFLVVKWERSGVSTYAAHLKAIKPRAVLDQTGIFATVTEPLEIGKTEIKPESEVLPSSDSRVEVLSDLVNRYGMEVSMKFKPVTTITSGGLPDTWREISVIASSTLGLTISAALIDAPAFRLNKVTGAMKSGSIKYQFTGIQYAKP